MTIHDRKTLVFTDDATLASVIRQSLDQPGEGFVTVVVRDLSAGIARLFGGGIDAILLDLFVPDSQGIDSFDEVFLAARRIPIVVLTEQDQEEVAREAVQRGAKDRMLKKQIDPNTFGLILRHILDHAAADDALYIERERAQVTLNSIGDAVISTDKSGYVTYVNPAAEKMTGWSHEQACGRMLTDVFNLIDGDTRGPAPNPMRFAVERNTIVGLPNHAVLIRRDGFESAIEDSIAPIHDQAGQIAGAVMVFRDVSKARAEELKLSHLAQHDIVTGLPNRAKLTDHLKHSIAMAKRYGRKVGVLFIDIDHFKQINDSFGHEVGDKLLQAIGARLTTSVRGSDTVCRYGGDEFLVVLSEVEQAQTASRHAARIYAALTEPLAVGKHELRVGISIGVSIFPDHGDDAETLIRCADAMYDAKARGRGTYNLFQPAADFAPK
jgi:diguanylate cyclase (GGDEF)-like protein/PAS domain S-box-containing protein